MCGVIKDGGVADQNNKCYMHLLQNVFVVGVNPTTEVNKCLDCM